MESQMANFLHNLGYTVYAIGRPDILVVKQTEFTKFNGHIFLKGNSSVGFLAKNRWSDWKHNTRKQPLHVALKIGKICVDEIRKEIVSQNDDPHALLSIARKLKLVFPNSDIVSRVAMENNPFKITQNMLDIISFNSVAEIILDIYLKENGLDFF